MDDYRIADALTGDAVTLHGDGSASMAKGDGALPACTTLFFPGCSFLNYAMPLVRALYDTLRQDGLADGISVLCCGKILSYEPDGVRVRAAFEDQLRERLASTAIKRIVCACPNCVKALRDALAQDVRTDDIEVVALPAVLAERGYQVDRDTAALLVKGDASAPVLLCTHDSCPDRETGEFADGLRSLLGEGLYVDPAHSRHRSLCCGSLPRAAGKFEAADELARRNGEEAAEVAADAIVTSCLSCAFQLTMAQSAVQVVNVFELLYNWRIDWATVGGLMKLRFLFDESLGSVQEGSEARSFVGLGVQEVDFDAPATVADVAAESDPFATDADREAAREVSISNADNATIGE